MTFSPMTEVKSSGAELPAAIKVAPATSGCRCKTVNKRIIILRYHIAFVLLVISMSVDSCYTVKSLCVSDTDDTMHS